MSVRILHKYRRPLYILTCWFRPPIRSSVQADQFLLPHLQESESKIVRLHIGELFLGSFFFDRYSVSSYPALANRFGIITPPTDEERERMVAYRSSIIELTPDDIHYLTLVKHGLSGAHLHYEYLSYRIPNWPFTSRPGTIFVGNKSLSIGVALSSLLYGGIHLLAWSAHFSTMHQALLWRISGVAIISGSPALFIVTMFEWIYTTDESDTTWKHYSSNWRKALEKLRRGIYRWYKWNRKRGGIVRFGLRCASLIAVLVILFFCLLYMVARVYLIVEAFISLGQCPEQVYTEPEWSRYFPHFS